MAILTRSSDKILTFIECLREDKQDFIADQLVASVDEAKYKIYITFGRKINFNSYIFQI